MNASNLSQKFVNALRSLVLFIENMNFTHFNGHFPAVHQFTAAKFSNSQIQPGTMIVTSAADGTIQYIRPEHNGTNFITSSASNSPVQSIPVAVNIPIPSDHRTSSLEQDVVTSQSASQHQLAAVVNAPVNKYPHAPSALLGWGEIPMMHHFDASKNLTALNVPYPHQAVNNSAFLSMQPPPTSATAASGMWPVKLMQSVATMTNEDSDPQPQDLCKVEEDKAKDTNSDGKASVLKSEQKDLGNSDDDSDDSSKSGGNGGANVSTEENRSEPLPLSVPVSSIPNGALECSQIQLQQQGSAMADYLSRLPATTIPLSLQHFFKYQTEAAPSIKREGDPGNLAGVFLGNTAITPIVNSQAGAISSPKKKKKKKSQKRPPRPKPGEIRVSTALDGSTLFCCPECHMAYPDRDLLQQHMSGHKMERRFVCNICGAGLKRKEHLDQHKKGHSDERPFVCSLCMKGFKRNEHLTRHFVIHSGEKTHACWECGKKFSRKDHLHKHTQTHIAKRVKAEMSQDSFPGSTPLSNAGGSGGSSNNNNNAGVVGASSTSEGTPQAVLTALSPQIPMQHSILPNIPHPLQLHHTMS